MDGHALPPNSLDYKDNANKRDAQGTSDSGGQEWKSTIPYQEKAKSQRKKENVDAFTDTLIHSFS